MGIAFRAATRARTRFVEAVDALREEMEALDFFALHLLHHVPEHDAHWGALAIGANIEGLPRPVPQYGGRSSQWLQQLESLSYYIKEKLEVATHSRSAEGRGPSDTGGNTNLWKETFGPAAWSLVTDALRLFDIFKPGQATGTEGGSFHNFVLAIYEYATGKEGEEHAKVNDWIKKIVKPTRLDRALEIEEDRLRAEEIAIFKGRGPLTEAQNNRLGEIALRLNEIHKQRVELWKDTWPDCTCKATSPTPAPNQAPRFEDSTASQPVSRHPKSLNSPIEPVFPGVLDHRREKLVQSGLKAISSSRMP
jgi:hypothetical protein